jgi:gluconate:H+ symporter, GntP family
MLFTASLILMAILAILLLSVRWKFNVFFVLLAVSALTGLAAGLPGERIIALLKTGLGGTVEKIGLLIILGTTLGVLLEKSGATSSIAQVILRLTGEKNAPLAMTLIGFGVGLPIFCDSGFVVLSGLALSLSLKSPKQHSWLIVCLASGLYAVHCLVPPHPGISAAAVSLGADLGQIMLWGTVASILPATVAYFWGKWANAQWPYIAENHVSDHSSEQAGALPSPYWAMLPIIVPILLIALKSLVLLDPELQKADWFGTISLIGDPVMALFIGILLALPLLKGTTREAFNEFLESALVKSGGILLVTAAGGAFGEVIKALDIGKVFGGAIAASGLGLLIPFLLAVVFKTAQGSSTVAVISVAGILAPLLPSLGLDAAHAKVCALLAIGAGSMVVSHNNDSYFWVVSRFGQLEPKFALRAFSLATLWMGLAGLAATYLIFYWGQ